MSGVEAELAMAGIRPKLAGSITSTITFSLHLIKTIESYRTPNLESALDRQHSLHRGVEDLGSCGVGSRMFASGWRLVHYTKSRASRYQTLA